MGDTSTTCAPDVSGDSRLDPLGRGGGIALGTGVRRRPDHWGRSTLTREWDRKQIKIERIPYPRNHQRMVARTRHLVGSAQNSTAHM